ncbi:hypothetical protein CLFO_35080 [Clostridium formicaceticum]|uniref:Uncharacterized protein n=1 Tax=Clostridium formicaceticum TaxID=1497 RepID=A0AAC9RP01_9CLOT|nr:hypothetical protein CLFO_35080 [Clostridium formicaceticum]
MLREIYLRDSDDKLIRYSVQILWSNQLLKQGKLARSEYEKITKKLKKDYIENGKKC